MRQVVQRRKRQYLYFCTSKASKLSRTVMRQVVNGRHVVLVEVVPCALRELGVHWRYICVLTYADVC